MHRTPLKNAQTKINNTALLTAHIRLLEQLLSSPTYYLIKMEMGINR
jgi:hypothetical protein